MKLFQLPIVVVCYQGSKKLKISTIITFAKGSYFTFFCIYNLFVFIGQQTQQLIQRMSVLKTFKSIFDH